jgi:hypothetical protein
MRVIRERQKRLRANNREETCLEIKNVVFERTKHSTVHGLSSVARSERYGLKLMWLIFFLVSFSVSIDNRGVRVTDQVPQRFNMLNKSLYNRLLDRLCQESVR